MAEVFRSRKRLGHLHIAECRAEIAQSELISSKLFGGMTFCILPKGDVEGLTLCRVSLWHQPQNDTPRKIPLKQRRRLLRYLLEQYPIISRRKERQRGRGCAEGEGEMSFFLYFFRSPSPFAGLPSLHKPSASNAVSPSKVAPKSQGLRPKGEPQTFYNNKGGKLRGKLYKRRNYSEP